MWIGGLVFVIGATTSTLISIHTCVLINKVFLKCVVSKGIGA